MSNYPHLFEPIQIGNVTIPNRIALEPMLLEVGEHDGTAGERLIAYYEERAKGGVGLIQTEVTRVSDLTGTTGPRQMSATSDRCIESFSKLADAVHKHGSKIFVQLHHTGRQNLQLVVTAWKLSDTIGRRWGGWWNIFYTMTKYLDFFEKPVFHHFYLPVVSASNIPATIGSTPVTGQRTHALTKIELGKIEDKFAEAALRCKKAGMDGVQLHASHGYLIQQFLSPYTNQRTDEYGGSLENRMRFLKEIIQKVQKLCGPDFPITVRLTVDEYFRMYGYDVGLRLDEGVLIAKELEKLGVAALDISSGTYETMNSWLEPTSFELGWRKGNAAAVKRAVNIPVIAANLIRTPEQAEQQLAEGTQDIIGLGRPLLADPYWAKKAQEGHPEDISRCVCCLWCIESMYNGAMIGKSGECAVNPRTCYETQYPLIPKRDGNGTVVVVGAGPAGLTAAKVLAQRGFKTIVFEKNSYIGGQFSLAAVPPHKEKLRWVMEDLATACSKAGVEFRLNTPATAEAIKELKPYAIFDATGGTAVRPAIPGHDLPNVCTITEILTGEVKLTGKKVAVIGSGMSGLETAEKLAYEGNEVIIVEMADTLAPGTWKQHIDDIVPKLEAKGTKFFTSYKLVEMKPNAIVIEDAKISGLRKEISVDNVVLALGVKKNGLPEDIKAITSRVVQVGDAAEIGRLANATHTAYKAAMMLP